MLRVLVFNGCVSVDPQPGEQWAAKAAVPDGDHLFAESTAELVDFDLFVIAVESQPHSAGPSMIVEEPIRQRIAAGGMLVCFCSRVDLGWLPKKVKARVQSGKVIGFEAQDAAWQPLRRVLLGEPSFAVQFEASDVVLARSADGQIVAGVLLVGSGKVLLLPAMRQTRQAVVRMIISELIPLCSPHLRPPRTTMDEPLPIWLSDYPIPMLAEVEKDLETLKNRRLVLESEIGTQEKRVEALRKYYGLLWYTGDPLEGIVHDALGFLGMPVQKEGLVDAVYHWGDNRLYIEIEGTTSSIGVKKGRQLMDYIQQGPEDLPIPYGAIIGNPSRLLPPKERFPGHSQSQPFVKELQQLARRFNPEWPLMTTVELFELVKRRLDGDETASDGLKAKLLPKGVP